MALTATQKAGVRLYLGYSDGSRDTPSGYNLEGVFAGLSAEAETQVIAILALLATVDAKFTESAALSAAGLKSVDNGGVEWFGATSAQSSLSATGRRLVARLAIILGVPVVRDVFGSAVPMCGPMGLG